MAYISRQLHRALLITLQAIICAVVRRSWGVYSPGTMTLGAALPSSPSGPRGPISCRGSPASARLYRPSRRATLHLPGCLCECRACTTCTMTLGAALHSWCMYVNDRGQTAAPGRPPWAPPGIRVCRSLGCVRPDLAP